MDYKFSVIIPIYNVEKYLREAIDSVINQSINFKYIQLILVNDGSTDCSDLICKKYIKKYSNIIYVKQENKGLSSARNEGIKYATGKYVNFLDSDDYFDLDVFQKVYEFFETNKNEIDLVAIRIKYCDSIEGFKELYDYKFLENKIVDIEEDYSFVQSFITSVFFKKSLVINEKFSTDLKFGEDNFYVNAILLRVKKYGILKDATYNYRKRFAKTSLIDNRFSDRQWYINAMEFCHLPLMTLSKELYGKVLYYIQFSVLYNIHIKIMKGDAKKILIKEDYEKYKNLIYQALKNIDDDIILNHRLNSINYKKHYLDIKYDGEEKNIYLNKLIKKQNRRSLKVDRIVIKENKIRLIGRVSHFLLIDNYKIFFKDDSNNIYKPKFDKDIEYCYGLNNEKICSCRKFKITIPLCNVNKISCFIKIGKKIHKIKINYGYLSGIAKAENLYCYKKGFHLYSENLSLNIKKITKSDRKQLEDNLNDFLYENKNFEIYYLRKIYFFCRKHNIKTKPVVFCNVNDLKKSDKLINIKKEKLYFIRKTSRDKLYNKEYGKTIRIDKFSTKLIILISRKKIFLDSEKMLKDVYKENFIYLKDLF